jgi:1-deoxy-D-xylulose-5-phosphate reductoisomerase
MRAPIRSALTWPERVPGPAAADLGALSGLEFEPPDLDAFPMLGLARAAGRTGGTAPAAFNAADEVAVEAFLAGRIAFPDIPRVVEAVMEVLPPGPAESVEALEAADRSAREAAAGWIAGPAAAARAPR